MSDAFIGEIRYFAVPASRGVYGWKLCDGAHLPISQFTLLYSVIFNTWGGDQQTWFALPKLINHEDGPIALCGSGQGPGLTNRVLGQFDGGLKVYLQQSELPQHSHSAQTINTPYGASATAFSSAGTVTTSLGRLQAVSGGVGVTSMAYGPVPTVQAGQPKNMMHPATLGAGNVGAGTGHENTQPSLTLYPYICYDGDYPQYP